MGQTAPSSPLLLLCITVCRFYITASFFHSPVWEERGTYSKDYAHCKGDNTYLNATPRRRAQEEEEDIIFIMFYYHSNQTCLKKTPERCAP